MCKTKLKNCPKWLLDANTENEDVDLSPNGILQWYGGSFLGGSFLTGDFLAGDFLGGDFLGCFRGGSFRGGSFRGEFRGGSFLGGSFLGGTVKGRRRSKVITTYTDCEGFPKTLVDVRGTAYILAGCRFFTLTKAIRHWKGREDRVITRATLHGAVALAKHLKLKLG